MSNLNSTLYHYTTDLNEVELLLDENGGEVTEEVNDKLVALGERGVILADDLYNYLAEKDAIIEACKKEAKVIAEIKRRAESTKDTIKAQFLKLMLDKGIESFKSDLHSMKVSAGRESVEVTDEGVLLKNFVKDIFELNDRLPVWASVKVEIHKADLANAIKSGELIRGAHIVRNPSLLVK